MFVQGFGEILADIMTINPSLSGISSASAILDTSNYTFQALTLGKDGEGFKYHGHVISSVNGSVYNNGYLQFIVYNTFSPSSYHTSATHNYYSAVYNSLPSYPGISDTRLERKSTASNYESSNLGHYLNAAIDPNLSNAWNVIGGYPPSGNVGKYLMLSSNGAMITSGNLSGAFNAKGIVDRYGFIRISQVSSLPSVSSFGLGPYIGVTSSLSSTTRVDINLALQMGDAASIAAFGGLYHFGIWAINIKELLRQGYSPPFNIQNINISSKYKLVAKATSWKDLLWHRDEPVFSFPGFKTLLVDGTGLTYLGPVYELKIVFT